jgi:hypothetical protein
MILVCKTCEQSKEGDLSKEEIAEFLRVHHGARIMQYSETNTTEVPPLQWKDVE